MMHGDDEPTEEMRRKDERLFDAAIAVVASLGGPRGRSRHGHVLVRSPPLRCRRVNDVRHGRVVAWCATAEGVDLSCALLRAGVVVRRRGFGGREVCGVGG